MQKSCPELEHTTHSSMVCNIMLAKRLYKMHRQIDILTLYLRWVRQTRILFQRQRNIRLAS